MESESGSWVVLVHCGYSEWFKTQDMRVYGPFESEAAANQWEQEQAHVEKRDGTGTVTTTAMQIAAPQPLEV